METIKRYELGILSKNSDYQSVKISCSQDSYDYIKQFYGDDINLYESFFLLLLNNSNETIAYAKIAQGGIVGTTVDPLIVAKYVVDSLSKNVIIAHNHPSGTTKPSDSDKQITRRIRDMLALFDVKLLDHIILTENRYFSFADEDLI